MTVRQATPQETTRVDELFAIAFEQHLKRSEPRKEDSRVHSWAAFDDDGEMMSTFSVSDFLIQFDGNHCKMGGIGGVATLPQYRRRGGIRGCFNEALPHMYDTGYDFSYLYPFSTAYYRKFGYESCVQKFMTIVDLGQLNIPAVDGYCRLSEGTHTMEQDIQILDRLWESQFNMMVIHEEKDYDFIAESDPAVQQEFTYVYYSKDGTPKAYTTFCKADQRDGRNLVCNWFFFADKEGFLGILNLFKSLATDHKHLKFVMPGPLPSMQYLFPEWSLNAVQWSIQPGGMVRVINVKSVLEKARYLGTGELTLEVNDPQIPQNCRRFRVVFENDKAVSVEETDAEPDVVLSIPTFSALIVGVCNFDEARNWMDGLEVRKENTCLNKVFYRKKTMIVDYF